MESVGICEVAAHQAVVHVYDRVTKLPSSSSSSRNRCAFSPSPQEPDVGRSSRSLGRAAAFMTLSANTRRGARATSSLASSTDMAQKPDRCEEPGDEPHGDKSQETHARTALFGLPYNQALESWCLD